VAGAGWLARDALESWRTARGSSRVTGDGGQPLPDDGYVISADEKPGRAGPQPLRDGDVEALKWAITACREMSRLSEQLARPHGLCDRVIVGSMTWCPRQDSNLRHTV
jgi:hypothetical protein